MPSLSKRRIYTVNDEDTMTQNGSCDSDLIRFTGLGSVNICPGISEQATWSLEKIIVYESIDLF